VSLHQAFITNPELWPVEMGRILAVTWELPTRLLATHVSASTSGWVLDHLARRDDASSRRTVDICAFDLAWKGRRQFEAEIY
jgi:hypothetical protein